MAGNIFYEIEKSENFVPRTMAKPLHHLHPPGPRVGRLLKALLTEFLWSEFNPLCLAAIWGCQHVKLAGAALAAIFKFLLNLISSLLRH